MDRLRSKAILTNSQLWAGGVSYRLQGGLQLSSFQFHTSGPEGGKGNKDGEKQGSYLDKIWAPFS